MKLTKQNLSKFGKTLEDAGFESEGQLLQGVTTRAFVVHHFGECDVAYYYDDSDVFLTTASAERHIDAMICKRMNRISDDALFYELQSANSEFLSWAPHLKKSDYDGREKEELSPEQVSEEATRIFGTDVLFLEDEFKVPEGATNEQLIQLARLVGYRPYAALEIQLTY